MPAVTVHVKVARPRRAHALDELQPGLETADVEVPAQVLLTERDRRAEDAGRVHQRQGTCQDRLRLQLLRVIDQLAETPLIREPLEVGVLADFLGTSEPEVDRLFQFGERLGLSLREIRKRTGEVIVPRGIVRQELHALSTRLLHRRRVARAHGEHELAPEPLVLRIASGIVPDRQDRQNRKQATHVRWSLIQPGSFTIFASRLWFVSRDAAVPMDGDSSEARRFRSACRPISSR